MSVRNATRDDLDRVLEIYEIARAYMKSTGNPDQWGQIYPPRELVEQDIQGQNLFALEYENEIYGVFAFFPDGDDAYDNIDGAWINDMPHAAIHRVASAGTRRGVLRDCVDFCLTRSSNLKIDTHTDNRIMQHQLKKAGFVECGTIYLDNGEPRIAFQLSAKQSFVS